MPAVLLKQQLQSMTTLTDERSLRPLLQALLDGVQALATKLDADAGVTDTNYRATLDAIVND